MSTTTITAEALYQARIIVAPRATETDSWSHDFDDWPAIKQHLDDQRRWMDIADALDDIEIPSEVFEVLLPLVEERLQESRGALDDARHSRSLRAADNTDQGWLRSLKGDLGMFDRVIAQEEADIAACEEFIGAASKVTS